MSEESSRTPKREPTAIDGRLEPDLLAELVAELSFVDPGEVASDAGQGESECDVPTAPPGAAKDEDPV